MRTSDDQRREVAARLRKIEPDKRLHGYVNAETVFNACGIDCDFGCVQMDGVGKLVNLVEPQPDLCWDVSGYQDVFECSECRCKVKLVTEVCNEYGEPFSETLIPRFCPNCGRGIVRAIKR